MKEHIENIRGLLLKIEEEEAAKGVDSFEHNFDALAARG